MKKIFNLLLTVLVVTVFVLPGFAKDSLFSWLNRMPGYGDKRGLYWDWGVYSTYDDHQLFCIKISTGIDDIIAKCDTWIDLPAKSTVAIITIQMSSTTLALGTTYIMAADSHFTQIGLPRNVTVGYGMYFATNVVYGNATVYGLNARGVYIYETILSTVGSTPRATNNAFAKVEKVLLGAITTPQNSLDIGGAKNHEGGGKIIVNIGTSDKIGFMGDLNQTTDYYKCTIAYTDSTDSITADITYDTWLHSTVPDGSNDYRIYYRLNSEVGDGF